MKTPIVKFHGSPRLRKSEIIKLGERFKLEALQRLQSDMKKNQVELRPMTAAA